MTNSFELDDDGNGEHADVVVCVRLTSPLLMPDNVIDICSQCGEAIQHRPHVPKQPRKMCWECIEPLALKMAHKGTLHTILTSEVAEDLLAYERKKSAH